MKAIQIAAERRPRRHFSRRTFFVIAALAIIMVSAGVAGAATAGEMEVIPDATGEVQVTTGQALAVVGGSITGAESGYVFVNDDQTAFKAPAQVYTGDRFTINLALDNKSQSPMDTQIAISAPEGMSLDVKGKDDVRDVVKVGADIWAFRLEASENEADDEPDLIITIAIGCSVIPGSYGLKCVIEPLTFEGGE